MSAQKFTGNCVHLRVSFYLLFSSYGLLMCEVIMRRKVEETTPRTNATNYGLDHQAFRQKIPNDCSPDLLKLAFMCTEYKPENRPDFREIANYLREIKQQAAQGFTPPQ